MYLRVYMHVCVYMCREGGPANSAPICLCVCVYMYVYVRIYMYVFACKYISVCICIEKGVQQIARLYIIYRCVHIYIYIYMCM